MKRLAAVVAIGLTAGGQAPAADSVVIGHGISNSFFSDAPCAPDLICMAARYLWILDVRRTVSGPSVVGRIRVVASQHTDANEQFVKSVELFVLKPIDDSSLQRTSGARYYLVALSARDSSGNYCLSVDPGGAGLKLDSLQVSVDAKSGFFCFRADLLKGLANAWSGRDE